MEEVVVPRIDVGDELTSLDPKASVTRSPQARRRTHLAELAESVESIESVLGFGSEESDEAERSLLGLAVEGLELRCERAKARVGDRLRVAV